MRWIHTPLPAAEVAAFSRQLGVSPVLAELLRRNGLREPEAAARFLRPALAELQDPFLLVNLDAAVARLKQAIARREVVVVLGDYDVDGVGSTVLLVSILRRFGLDPRFVVPLRLEEGYGLSRGAIDRALEAGRPDLFVALDCGTNSHDELAYLQAQGVDAIVIDHHRSKDKPLGGGILVNPHVHAGPEDAPWRNLCTVGLVFKLVHGLLKQLRADNHPVAYRIKLKEYLDLVAMGTVADLVPLVGENRILSYHGLRILQETQRRGLRALMDVSGLRPGQEIQPVDISFRLGPRINASGRLADAALSVELMLSDDAAFCTEAAHRLDDFNRERQEIERQITEAAERVVEAHYGEAHGLVLFDEAWHPGVVGIVASRVTRKYHRPCIVLGHENGLAKGSGRSIYGLNLVEMLGSCADLLASWGGHPMAVGVTLPRKNLEAFRERFSGAVRVWQRGQISEPGLEIASWLTLEQVRESLMEELGSLHPFGQGNPEPIFGLRGVRFLQRPEVFKEQHFRFHLSDADGRRVYGVAWKLAHRVPPVGTPVDLAVQLAWNFHNDRKLLQMELLDWRPSEALRPDAASL
ncbi:MAG TPA: single-stranded-DNA-specific exonuclease RecJ [Opitutaceae bacterium]|nr:single-stranded-DNA-specific exonuclease RecJ [Opitutaceae bacterium]